MIVQINRLKKQKDAVILAHNYQTPQIYHGVADIVGDTLRLAQEAARVRQSVIVQCGVHFMAETSKLLNPGKTVLIPDSRAGCSLASSITAEDVMAMRAQYPGVPVVTYVNTSAAVKAVTDVCCTSSSALDIVNAVEGDTVIMIPDQFLAQNTAKKTRKKIITWAGACEVHETFTADDIAELRHAYPPGVDGRVRVALRRTPQGFELLVADEGVGLDAALSKSTYASAMGVAAARSKGEALVDQGVRALQMAKLQTPHLERLARFVAERGS